MRKFLILSALLCLLASPVYATLDVGATRISADSVIGPSGVPIVLYGYCIVSGGTAGDVIFRDGTTTSGAAQLEDKGTASEGVVVSLANGVVFNNGLFADIDADVTTLDVYFRRWR